MKLTVERRIRLNATTGGAGVTGIFRWLLALWLGFGGVLHATEGKTVTVFERDGRSYVGAKSLAAVLQIGLKPLPGRPEFAVCYQERCAVVRSVVAAANGDQLVEVEALAEALDAEAIFDAGRKSVGFRFSKAATTESVGPPQIGGFAPNFKLTTLTGGVVSLADFRGRRVLINSWASWCGCRNDLPVWQKFYEQHCGGNFEILSVAVDVQGAKVVRPYVEKAGVTFTVAVDETDVLGRAFGMKHTPVSLLVDELGILRAQGGGPRADFLAQVEAVLKEPVSDLHKETRAVLPAEAKAELEKAVAASPHDCRTRLALAERLIAEREFGAAAKQLDRAAELKPQSTEVHFLSGQLLLLQDQREAALAKFREALQLDPANWRIRKQIWAVENPDKFYSRHNPDYGWQKRQLEEERTPGTPAAP